MSKLHFYKQMRGLQVPLADIARRSRIDALVSDRDRDSDRLRLRERNDRLDDFTKGSFTKDAQSRCSPVRIVSNNRSAGGRLSLNRWIRINSGWITQSVHRSLMCIR
jgi:hypothetical protein